MLVGLVGDVVTVVGHAVSVVLLVSLVNVVTVVGHAVSVVLLVSLVNAVTVLVLLTVLRRLIAEVNQAAQCQVFHLLEVVQNSTMCVAFVS